jgi:glycosyltransferase involved in cell wall biosynthesis
LTEPRRVRIERGSELGVELCGDDTRERVGAPAAANAQDAASEALAPVDPMEFLLPVGDIDGFAARLDAIVDEPPRYRSRGERGRERAATLFSSERIVGEYLEFYRHVLAGEEKPRR